MSRKSWKKELAKNRLNTHEAPKPSAQPYKLQNVPNVHNGINKGFKLTENAELTLDSYLSQAAREGFIPPYDEPGYGMSIRNQLLGKLQSVDSKKQKTLLKSWIAGLRGKGIEREKQLVDLTTPNMKGFFPAYTSGDRHSQVITGFDTETDDFSNIIELAGLRLTYNFTKGRFEQLEDSSKSQFVANYISATNKLLRSSEAHGYTQSDLKVLQFAQNLKGALFKPFQKHSILTGYSAYTQRDRKSFLSWALQDNAMLLGHNILQADIPWLYQHKSGGLPQEQINFGFLDSFHLSEALVGKAQKTASGDSDGRNKLQNLAKRFHVSAEDLGLQAHKGYNDVIVAFKVVEALLKAYPTATASREFLFAMEHGNIQTHKYNKNINEYGFFEGKGKLIEGVGGKKLMQRDDEDLFGFEAFDPEDAKKIIEDATQQTQFEGGVGFDANGNNTGFGYADEEPEESTGWINPKRKMSRQHAPLPDLPVDTFGSGRVEALAEARRMFKAGASYSDVKSALSTVFRGSDVVLDKGMLDTVLGMAMKETGLEAKYNQWKEIQRAANLEKYEKVHAFQAGLEKHRDNLYKVIAKRKQQVEDFKASHRGMSPMDVLYKPGVYHGSHEEWVKTKQEAREALKYENMLHNNQQMVVAAEKRLAWSKKSEKAQVEGDEKKQQEKLDAFLKWGTTENPASNPIWEAKSKEDIEAQQYAAHVNQSIPLREYVAKREAQTAAQIAAAQQQAQEQKAWDFQHRRAESYRYKGLLSDKDLDKLNEITSSTEDYADAMDKVIFRNRKLISMAEAFAQIPFYDPMRLVGAVNHQYGGIKSAAHGILPNFLETPLFKLADAFKNSFNQTTAELKQASDVTGTVGKGVLGAIGAGVGTVLGGGPGAIIGWNMGKGIAEAATQVYGTEKEKQITQIGEGIQLRLNLLAALTTGIAGFASMLKLATNLLGKFASYMPSYTLHTLTGIKWDRAVPMQQSDRMLGFQAGTTANLYAQLAYQQADLYTSGMYDEKKLVAAARLGIFDLAYGAMGGDIEQQQSDIYDRMYKRLYESGKSKAEIQSDLSLLKQYSPELVNMLEVGHEYVEAGHKEYRNYGAFSDKKGYQFLKQGSENIAVRDMANRWGLAQTSFYEGASLLMANKVFPLAEPIIKAVEKGLWEFARNGEISDSTWDALKTAVSNMWDSTIGKINFEEIDWSNKLKFLDPLIKELGNKLKPLENTFISFISELMKQLGSISITFHKEGLLKLLAGQTTTVDEIVSTQTVQQQIEARVQAAKTSIAKTQDRFEAYVNSDPEARTPYPDESRRWHKPVRSDVRIATRVLTRGDYEDAWVPPTKQAESIAKLVLQHSDTQFDMDKTIELIKAYMDTAVGKMDGDIISKGLAPQIFAQSAEFIQALKDVGLEKKLVEDLIKVLDTSGTMDADVQKLIDTIFDPMRKAAEGVQRAAENAARTSMIDIPMTSNSSPFKLQSFLALG